MVALDVLVVSTALGAIRNHFGASLNELEWTVNAYNLSFAVVLIPARFSKAEERRWAEVVTCCATALAARLV